MLTSVEIKNFKCLEDVKVDLGPFTVLIGPNDSGKTSFLEALQILGRTVRMPIEQALSIGVGMSHGSNPMDAIRPLLHRQDLTRWLEWHVLGKHNNQSFKYDLGIRAMRPIDNGRLSRRVTELLEVGNETVFAKEEDSDGRADGFVPVYEFGTTCLHTILQTRFDRHLPIADCISAIEEYRLSPDQLRQPCSLSPSPELNPDGGNLAAVLEAAFTGKNSNIRAEMENALRSLVPTLDGFSLTTTPQGQKAIEFALSGADVAIPAAFASDGAMIVTAYLALIYGTSKELILIEEPENGVHHNLLAKIVDWLRKISRGEFGRPPKQVIITTHSPILLNHVSLDDVRIFQRTSEGGVQVTPMAKIPRAAELMRDSAPGEMWYLLGESGLLQGPPLPHAAAASA